VRTVKAGGQLLTIIQHCIAARQPLQLVGAHGVGKSQILEQAAREMGIGYICRDLSLMEPPDLVGLPKLDGNVTRYLPPAFLPTEGKGLLVFEELNRCPTYMRAPCLQLLTARTLNDYRLPEGWSVAAAINPPEGGYEVSDLDAAIQSRFVRVRVEPDRKEWLDWAAKAGVHPDVRNYVASDPKIFQDDWSNPRAWKMVSDLLLANGFDGRGDPALKAILAGVVGIARGAAFLNFCKSGERSLDAADVLGNYPAVADSIREWVKKGRTDQLDALVHGIKVYLQTDFESVSCGPEWTALACVLDDLPADLRADLIQHLEETYGDSPCPPQPPPKGKRRKKP
jgi:hypothetical protein